MIENVLILRENRDGRFTGYIHRLAGKVFVVYIRVWVIVHCPRKSVELINIFYFALLLVIVFL
jgi:hypothetical protein